MAAPSRNVIAFSAALVIGVLPLFGHEPEPHLPERPVAVLDVLVTSITSNAGWNKPQVSDFT
jgi:hypothetical protein